MNDIRLYSFKEEFVIKQDGCWTGHIDDYYNKYFDFLRMDPMIIPLTSEVADIVDKCNDIDWNIYNSIQKECNTYLQSIVRNNIESPLTVEEIRSICSEAQIKEFDKLLDLINLTYNTCYEFNDVTGQRRTLDILKCELKQFEGQKDIDIYFEKLKEVNEFNEKAQKEMNEFLLSKDAFTDYFNYHTSRTDMFREISNTVHKLQKEGKI